MNVKTIREKVRKGDFDLSLHAHKERQTEKISIKEIKQTILKGDIIISIFPRSLLRGLMDG